MKEFVLVLTIRLVPGQDDALPRHQHVILRRAPSRRLLAVPCLAVALVALTGCPLRAEPRDDDDSAVLLDDDDSAVDDDDATTPPPECMDDAFEENDSFDAARVLAPGAYNNLTACPFDDDWYEIQMPAGFRVTVQLVFSHENGDIDLSLRNEDGALIEGSSSSSDNEQVGPIILYADQSLFLEVDLLGFGGDPPGNTYGIAIVTEALPN